jgi:hypothetical protein
MSRANLAERLMGEVYAATHYDPEKFMPMDPRRIKRMCSLAEKLKWDDAETGNRIMGAIICSQASRKESRI